MPVVITPIGMTAAPLFGLRASTRELIFSLARSLSGPRMFFASRRPRLAMNAAFAASPLLAVREQRTQPATTPLAPRHKFEKTFAIESDGKTAVAIDRLVISAPGFTFVSFSPDAETASVKVSAEFADVPDLYEVVAHDQTGLEIRLKESMKDRHYVLTEVTLPVARALRSLDLTGSASVVVEDQVLVSNDPHADVKIRVLGSGMVFAANQSDVLLRSLALDLVGSGDIQFVAPSLSLRDHFKTTAMASGDARVFTGSLTAPVVKLSTMGSGDMQIAALRIEALEQLSVSTGGSGQVKTVGETCKAESVELSVMGSGEVILLTHADFDASVVKSSVSGSGEIFVASTNARCQDEKVSVTGSGTVDAGDLVARRASVNVMGSGDVLIRATEQVDSHVIASGSVTVVGDRPASVSGSVSTVAEKPSQLERLSGKRHGPLRTPTRVNAFEELTCFNGKVIIRSFSEFISAMKSLWNHRDALSRRSTTGTAP